MREKSRYLYSASRKNALCGITKTVGMCLKEHPTTSITKGKNKARH